MYSLLFTSALPGEIKVVKSMLKTLDNKIKIEFLSTGIGSYKTILNLAKYLSENKYDFLVNIGICGYLKEKSLFQVARISNIHNGKELLIPIPFKFLSLDSIACSENIVYDKKNLQDENYVDMESYGFELVCDDFKIPRIILKVPYDEIGSTETKEFDKDKLDKLLKQIDYNKLIEEIVKFLEKHKKDKIDFSKYFEHYKLTFSEKLIFEKMYYKYVSLVGENFDKFFEENKTLSKKEFLEELGVI
ncbi:hypothetical protein EOM39_01940 [Candidatus Gracilibacteria bacterium]|nr:hypothetical protein [Candidatus Gracilibacteria bacterium]